LSATYLKDPVIKYFWELDDDNLPVSGKCILGGKGTMVKEGRDLYFKTLGSDDSDKCRGKCHIMSTRRCRVRPQFGNESKGHSKYCVPAANVQIAKDCWQQYKKDLRDELVYDFQSEIAKLREFHSNATRIQEELLG